MFRTILWATDGSETAGHALPFALELVKRDSAKLVVVHISELVVGRMGGYPIYADEPDLRARLIEQVETLRETGLEVELVERKCVAGHAAKLIAEVAGQHDAGLIVLGTHGHTRIGSALIGTMTQALLHEGTVPVLAVPVGARVAAVV